MPANSIFGNNPPSLVGGLSGAATQQIGSQIGGAVGGVLGFGGGAISQFLASLMANKVTGATNTNAGGNTSTSFTPPYADALMGSATKLSDAAQQLSDAATQMGSPPALGASFSGHQWVTDHTQPGPNGQPGAGVPTLMSNQSLAQFPTATAAPGAGAGAGAAAGGGLAAAAGPVGIAVVAAMAIKEASDKVFEGFQSLVGVIPRTTEGLSGLAGLPKSMGSLIGSGTELMVTPARMAGQALHQMISPIEMIQDPLKMAKMGFEAVANVGASVARVLWDMRDPAAMLSGAISPFVSQISKFNPGLVDRMNLSFDNLSAAAGRMFEPIIPIVTAFADELNGAYTAIGGTIRPLMGDLAGLGVGIGRELFASMFSIIGEGVPVVRQFIRDLEPFAPVARTVLGVFTDMAGGAIRFAGQLASGFMGFLAPIAESGRGFIGFLREGATILGNLWGVATTLMAPFVELGGFLWRLSGIGTTLSGAFNVAVSSVQGFQAAMVAATTVLRWIGENPMAATDPAGLAGIFRTAYNGSILNMQNPAAPPGAQLPGGQGMTAAAQQSRFTGIEEVGMEARRAAFSQGQSIQEQTLTVAQDQLRVLTELLTQQQAAANRTLVEMGLPEM